MAAESRNLAMVELLLEYGCRYQLSGAGGGSTSLMLAVKEGLEDKCKLLQGHDDDVRLRD